MSVKLKVLSYKGLPLPNEMIAEFGQQGGTIGRKAGNTLVLADAENFVSGHHADILFQQGQYFIRDTSKNGTYLAKAGINLNEAQSELVNQEILRIGEYDILVEISIEVSDLKPIELENIHSSLFSDPFADDRNSLVNQPLISSLPQEPTGPLFAERPLDAVPFHDSFALPDVMVSHTEPPKEIADFLKGLDSLISPEIAATPTPTPDLLSDEAELPAGAPATEEVVFDSLFSAKPEVSPLQRKVELSPADSLREAENIRPSTQVQSAMLMQMFLEGAGLGSQTFLTEDQWPEVMRTTGALFRTMIEGLMDVLRARAEMKSEFRVSVTTIRSFDNNPLKFNPDVDSVLKLMLGPHNPAFINSTDAVNEAFRDIKYHQIAMAAGIQAALENVLRSFEPECFEKVLGEGILFQKKARCWELYSEKYPELKSRVLEDFFGEDFAEAYDKQMRLFARR